MSVPDNRGGMRPNAPQNNPANVSATGGNGKSGTQAPKYIPGMKAMGSTGTETMAQQQAAAMAGPSSQPQGLSELSPLTAETEFRDQPITDGAPIGDGANSVANLPMGVSEDPDIQSAAQHLPIIEWYASQPGSTLATREYASYLRNVIINSQPETII
jgi:hypothetical protein